MFIVERYLKEFFVPIYIFLFSINYNIPNSTVSSHKFFFEINFFDIINKITLDYN
jgi:hypothetical protein